MNLLAKETAASILSDAGLTIVIGIVVVFAMLLLLVFVIKVFGTLMSRIDKLEATLPPVAAAEPVPAASVPIAAPIVGNTEPVSTCPEIQNGIEDEVVAAISGAVACMAPAGTQYAVRRIVRG